MFRNNFKVKPKKCSNSCYDSFQTQTHQHCSNPQIYLNNNLAYFTNKYNFQQSNQATSSVGNHQRKLIKLTGFHDIRQPVFSNPKRLTLLYEKDIVGKHEKNDCNCIYNPLKNKTSEDEDDDSYKYVMKSFGGDKYETRPKVSADYANTNKTNRGYGDCNKNDYYNDGDLFINNSADNVNLISAFNKKLNKSKKKVRFLDMSYDDNTTSYENQTRSTNEAIKSIVDQKHEVVSPERLKAKLDFDKQELIKRFNSINDEIESFLNVNTSNNIEFINSRYVFMDKKSSSSSPKKRGFLNVMKCMKHCDRIKPQ